MSVKLVAEPGVGTIAAGVAKAYADLITISGYDGGTGASPHRLESSTPARRGNWACPKRSRCCAPTACARRVRVQTDGGLKTGLDVIKAAILGAESFGFGTAPMVALGCKYLRICHLNNCATGIATQNDALREDHFIGLPEMVMNYFTFVAEETRELMASLGVRNLNDLIGRTDLLDSLGRRYAAPGPPQARRAAGAGRHPRRRAALLHRRHAIPRSTRASWPSRWWPTRWPRSRPARRVELAYEVRNINRSIGARLSGEIARRTAARACRTTP